MSALTFQAVKIHPSSTLHNKRAPAILYDEIVHPGPPPARSLYALEALADTLASGWTCCHSRFTRPTRTLGASHRSITRGWPSYPCSRPKSDLARRLRPEYAFTPILTLDPGRSEADRRVGRRKRRSPPSTFQGLRTQPRIRQCALMRCTGIVAFSDERKTLGCNCIATLVSCMQCLDDRVTAVACLLASGLASASRGRETGWLAAAAPFRRPMTLGEKVARGLRRGRPRGYESLGAPPTSPHDQQQQHSSSIETVRAGSKAFWQRGVADLASSPTPTTLTNDQQA